MKNYEWIMKNWDKKVNDKLICNTIGLVIAKTSACGLIKKCIYTDCSECIHEWLNEEATKDNNIYFNDVQKD